MAGILTFQQMQDEALDNVAKAGVLTLQSGTQLKTRMATWINRGQLWIARKADILPPFDYTTSTVASQQTYSFPTGVRRIFSLRFMDGLNSRKLTCVMPWEMDKKVPNATALTTARSWFYIPYKESGTFQLFPIPDNAYTLELRCSTYPAALVNPSDTTAYSNGDDAIVAFATMFAFRWLQETKDARDWELFGNEIVAMMKENADEANRYVDWSPGAEGFSSHDIDFTGQYYNNPFVRDTNLNTWWR